MQGNPNSEFLKSFFLWNLGNIDGRIQDPGLWNPESRIRDFLEFPYMGRQGDALTTNARRNWNSLMTLFYSFGQRY